jgi:hypothetical protein
LAAITTPPPPATAARRRAPLVPLAWLMMLPPAWAVARLVAGGPGIAFILTAALAFTAWDLFLDPQMVAWGAGYGINRAATLVSPGKTTPAGCCQPP